MRVWINALTLPILDAPRKRPQTQNHENKRQYFHYDIASSLQVKTSDRQQRWLGIYIAT